MARHGDGGVDAGGDALLVGGLAVSAFALSVLSLAWFIHSLGPHGRVEVDAFLQHIHITGTAGRTAWIPAVLGLWIFVTVWMRSGVAWSGIALLGVFGAYHLTTYGGPYLAFSGLLAWGVSRVRALPGPASASAHTVSQSDK